MEPYLEQLRNKELRDHNLSLWTGFTALAGLAGWFCWGIAQDFWRVLTLKEAVVSATLEDQQVQLQIDPEFAADAQFTTAKATNLSGEITLTSLPISAQVFATVFLFLAFALMLAAIILIFRATKMVGEGHGFSKRVARYFQLAGSFAVASALLPSMNSLGFAFTTDLGLFDGIASLTQFPGNSWLAIVIVFACSYPVGLAGLLGARGTELEQDTQGLV